ncbi:DM13 domain-containing protein [Lentilitoribacter sp. EG35]|uniref:DM13 domain-containing protein n=1 Tax=Lentilitoribacter sp. EG35 TaxID=3234192 RepID=UPI003461737F
MRILLRLITHGIALGIGFAGGIYALPILIAPPSVDRAMLETSAKDATYQTSFIRELKGSDFLHWGEGDVSISMDKIVHQGTMAPGPDYKIYLTKEFVEDEDSFNAIKASSLQVGEVKTFDGFIADLGNDVDVEAYNTVVIWCETFGEFITAAKYR